MTKITDLKLKNASHAAYVVIENKSGTHATIRQVGKARKNEDGKSLYLYLELLGEEMEIIIKEYTQSHVI